MRSRTWMWLLGGCLALIPPAAAGEYETGVAAFRRGDFAAAETSLSRVVDAQPDQLQARYFRARARVELGRLEAASQDLEAIVAAKPESVASRALLGLVLERRGLPAEARAAWQRVLADDPRNATAREGLARLAAAPPAAGPAATEAPASVAAPPAPEPGLRSVGAAGALGPHVGVTVEGLGAGFPAMLSQSGLSADGAQLLDYTFGSAPTEWVPTSGVWQVSSRFACDPTWSFFGGHSQGLAIVWNKRRFTGDLAVEAYVSFKHGLPWNSATWSYRPADLCLTLCGDGQDPASGYSFIYAGDEGSRTMIKKGGQVLASTSDPRFLSPSYNDVRPSTEDFHRRWWRLEARLTGSRVTFLVDGQEALSVDDPEPLRAGQIALWTVRNGMMVARVRVAYEQELRPDRPAVRVERPEPLPDEAPTARTVASAR